MAKGAWTLGEYPLPMVRVSCAKCGRAGQYHRAKLLERYGADMAMPELRHELAQCSRRRTMNDPCMVIFSDRIERT
ncbi:hypothetical protein SAE02_77690 [Skermanella aerolata]|uniref:Uncharacterized protein n=1 Tax=Skermanella aerolata TaxID=393310 RepID=A0A512E4I3_9PROT|nr:hypothetical protein [Skermanella aerolata]GEO43621.1 hypothetical protein SAE02_77690 [Skermanella aerolata]